MEKLLLVVPGVIHKKSPMFLKCPAKNFRPFLWSEKRRSELKLSQRRMMTVFCLLRLIKLLANWRKNVANVSMTIINQKMKTYIKANANHYSNGIQLKKASKWRLLLSFVLLSLESPWPNLPRTIARYTFLLAIKKAGEKFGNVQIQVLKVTHGKRVHLPINLENCHTYMLLNLNSLQ